MPHQRTRFIASLGLMVTAAIMGGQFAVCKLGIKAGLTYQDIVALRVVFANIVALPYCILNLPRLWAHHGIGRLALIVILSGAPYSLLFYYAISLTPTAHGAVIVPGSMALLGAVLGAYFLGERLGRVRIACLGALVLGLVAVSSSGLLHSGANVLLGDILFFFVALAWAVYTILFKRYGFTAMEAVSVIMVGSLLYLPLYYALYTPDFSTWPVEQILIQGGYHGVLHALLAMPLFAFGVRALGAGSASMAMAMIPVFGLAIAVLFMGETPSNLQWAGIALVVGAMGFNAWWRSRKIA